METVPPVLDEDQNLAAIAQQEQDRLAQGKPADKPADEPADEPAEKLAEETEEEIDPKGVLKYFDEVWGHKQAEKYKDDDAFLAAYDELIRHSGKRDEDALLGKKVRGRLAEDQLTALLSDGTLPQATPAAKQGQPFNPAWVTTDEKGQTVVAPGAPKDALERYQQMQQRMLAMADDPESFFEKAMEPRLKELREANETLRKEIQQEKEDLEIAAWLDQNANLVYVDGDQEKGWSSQGEKILAWARDPDHAAETPRVLTRLKYGAKFAAAENRRPPRPKLPRSAKRQADVAGPAPKPKDDIERFRAGVSLATVLAEEAGL